MRKILVAAALAVGGCSQAPVLSVDKGYVRLAAIPSRPAVAYFTIHGGTADTTLLSVSSDVSVKSELHESMTSGNMATMKPIIRSAPTRAATRVNRPTISSSRVAPSRNP